MGLRREMENPEDYSASASATTLRFDQPIPLLRGPIPAGASDDPELGPYVLAFRSPESWAAAFKRCETLIKEQCEEGARIGCAVTASKNCKPPWWRSFVDRNSSSMREREKCEAREFEGCLAAAKEKCAGFAKEKCSGAFFDARIAVAREYVDESSREVEGLVWLASMPEESRWRDLMGLHQLGSRVQAKHKTGVTNCRARDLVN